MAIAIGALSASLDANAVFLIYKSFIGSRRGGTLQDAENIVNFANNEPTAGWKNGDVLRSISLAGYNFTETSYFAKANLPYHSHDCPYICFILQGNFVEKQKKREHLFGPATAIFHPSGETHKNYFYSRSRCLNIELCSDSIHKLPNNEQVSETTEVFKDGEIIHLAYRLYREFCLQDAFSVLTIQGLMLEILAETLRRTKISRPKNAPRWLVQIKSLITEEFTENISIEGLAKSENVHPTHLAREFKRFFGVTIGDNVRTKRIEFACGKLGESDASIREIALQTGFFDQSHFTRVFKHITRTTPAAYRKNLLSR
ncbi:MAG: helix-turn-helix transcriptional regulator [Acidobacteria bacterium]|nr:helix-turn-helix transcriptional regulator [Acidobacteriota bacterium]